MCVRVSDLMLPQVAPRQRPASLAKTTDTHGSAPFPDSHPLVSFFVALECPCKFNRFEIVIDAVKAFSAAPGNRTSHPPMPTRLGKGKTSLMAPRRKTSADCSRPA